MVSGSGWALEADAVAISGLIAVAIPLAISWRAARRSPWERVAGTAGATLGCLSATPVGMWAGGLLLVAAAPRNGRDFTVRAFAEVAFLVAILVRESSPGLETGAAAGIVLLLATCARAGLVPFHVDRDREALPDRLVACAFSACVVLRLRSWITELPEVAAVAVAVGTITALLAAASAAAPLGTRARAAWSVSAVAGAALAGFAEPRHPSAIVGLTFAGILLAVAWGRRPPGPARSLPGVAFAAGLWIDDLYDAWFLRPARALRDQGLRLARVGSVALEASLLVLESSGQLLKLFYTGRVRHASLWVVAGAMLALVWFTR